MHITVAIPKQRAQFLVLLHNGKHKRRAGQAAMAPIIRSIPFGTRRRARAASSSLETHCSRSSGSSW